MPEPQHLIGETSITKIPELDLNDYTVTQLLPSLSVSSLEKQSGWFDQRTYDSKTGKVFLSVHIWLVKHNGMTILIDTGAGNRKDRPTLKALDHLHQPFISRLAAAGVDVNDVDYILQTHLHADHVGWNTSREEGAWVPTFPNATVICSDLEWRYGAALAKGDDALINEIRKEANHGEPIRLPVAGVWDDSIEPIRAAGKLERVRVDGSEVLDGIRFLPTPGHSIDHASIVIRSGEEEALFGGDVLHHPFELIYPNVLSMFCEFPEAARRSRRSLLELAEKDNVTYFSSHFPESSVGKIRREGEAYRWHFLA